MPDNMFNQESDYREVHPVLAQLVKQMLTPQPRQIPQGGGGPQITHQMPFQQVGQIQQQPEQQQPGLLNQVLGGLMGNMSIFNKVNKGQSGNTVFPSSSGVDNSWWNSGVDYQPNGRGYQNVYNGPFSNLFG